MFGLKFPKPSIYYLNDTINNPLPANHDNSRLTLTVQGYNLADRIWRL